MSYLVLKIFIIVCIVCFVRSCIIAENGISQTQKNEIINWHNTYRYMIANGRVSNQPRSRDMKRMYWDNDLAAASQRIAETCQFSHVKVNDRRWQVGQNLYMSSNSASHAAKWYDAVKAWYDEYKIYRFGSGFSKATGHYTQIVWANTNRVGCGYTKFYTGGRFKYRYLYVCNYGPAGNWAGQSPYQVGNGCQNLC